MTLIFHKKIFQDVRVLVYQYPFSEKVNSELHQIILNNSTRGDKNPNIGKVHMTSWTCFNEFKLIGNWVKTIVDSFGGKLHPIDVDTVLPSTNIKLTNIWGQWYEIDDFQSSHSHWPNHWSFCYYVNTPPGSSPMVFDKSKLKIKPKSGQLLIFPGWVNHSVPKNKGYGRSVISGNLYYER
jgi:hypothetical protein